MRRKRVIAKPPQKRWLLVEMIGGRRGRGGKGQLIFWSLGGPGVATDWRRGSPVQLLERDRKRLIAIFNKTIEAHTRARAREATNRIASQDACIGHPWTHKDLWGDYQLFMADKIIGSTPRKGR